MTDNEPSPARDKPVAPPPATDPTGIGPPPAGAAVAPDGAVTSEPPSEIAPQADRS